ncbi:MAG: ATPase domain-containing protein [Candidatus Helarchaeota archaeon]
MKTEVEIDEIDRQILQVLEEDPRISNKKISEIVGLTPQAVGIRIKKLREARIIGGIKILQPLPQPKKPVKKIERFKTNIPGLDNHIGGGIPIPSTVLLEGESGAGTTVFSLKLLWTALTEGYKCAYFTIERPQEQVIQQMKSFGWDPSQIDNVKFIDVNQFINQRVREYESISHLDVLQIYREMNESQKNLMPDVDVIFLDNISELLKIVKGSQIEWEFVKQIGINILKHRKDRINFYIVKKHVISNETMLTLKSYSDMIIQFRKCFENQQLKRYLFVEKMLSTGHTQKEIEFHITPEGIILNEYMLQHLAMRNPVPKKGNALLQVKELDYLTQGLGFGTIWLLEIDNLFPLCDLIKLYANFFTDGLARNKLCRFATLNYSLQETVNIFEQAIHYHKNLRKYEAELFEFIKREQFLFYDFYQNSVILDDVTSELFTPIVWSHNPENNLANIWSLFTHPDPNVKNSYLGYMISDLLGPPHLKEEQILTLQEWLIKHVQKQKDVLLITINPVLHSNNFLNRLEFVVDGIIKLWISSEENAPQEKYLQVLKNPVGKPSTPHILRVGDKPPYLQVI